jgi:hypothetical protein
MIEQRIAANGKRSVKSNLPPDATEKSSTGRVDVPLQLPERSSDTRQVAKRISFGVRYFRQQRLKKAEQQEIRKSPMCGLR